MGLYQQLRLTRRYELPGFKRHEVDHEVMEYQVGFYQHMRLTRGYELPGFERHEADHEVTEYQVGFLPANKG